ncbi:DNA repair protein RecO [Candidatus Wolfebacteria bacterium CG18_big_fil_WC_8_21_14_2_50_39_7]|uniref:DNA repair protein RecO n=4 Tax=Candidatus Wolfeibacteriota TaxID=1752735 RepID=A0A2M7Q6I5_9BACT|nr:DNA repair protein RecO [Parcubacteria group bacterium]NCO89352.1 DNA repair protein RecO [Candidatus Wolfebacteria bacterium]OIO65057.1 MAG: DNA repair protein RecO [Candidatus Wolfebacteria bacterium CG1_02_39_135]PIP91916.1 MAG: DNA repair protein RecO [Candidatus Wolfebacteria bacterium CG18_big_fil_WC_8_21_14_2_50_39_7]PIY59051.1 MAG: DNA repair protein RecO [Candidatus Wolfebacteria bacterium CG_4_10_14_0_8_um_filter_39_64]PJB83384.1 MAG: DNA repair protein RecO [Candidatus Wolfebacte
MIEYFTKALVLDQENSGEFDKLIFFYTEDLGKVVAKAKSIRKITSKLASQLEPLNFVRVRLVKKNGFQVVDALAFDKIKASQPALELVRFIKEMTFELQPDRKFWLLIRKTFQNLKNNKKFSYKPLLKALGFALDFARCSVCDSKFVVYFSKTEQVFLCRRCAPTPIKDFIEIN